MIQTEITILYHKSANLAEAHVAFVDNSSINKFDCRTMLQCAPLIRLGALIGFFFGLAVRSHSRNGFFCAQTPTRLRMSDSQGMGGNKFRYPTIANAFPFWVIKSRNSFHGNNQQSPESLPS